MQQRVCRCPTYLTMFASCVGADEETPMPADLLPMATGPARVVHIQRRPDIEAVRSGLPITSMEQEVMEAVLQNDVVVLCGETGCGKTTQVGMPTTLPDCNHCHFRHDKNHTMCAIVHVSLLCSSGWSSCFCGVTVSLEQSFLLSSFHALANILDVAQPRPGSSQAHMAQDLGNMRQIRPDAEQC